ncbi:MAG: hypothetical protein J5861_08935 [Desulfovibrio sp.]|nr:hypothetical protein [Desulfovibrio sp.]
MALSNFLIRPPSESPQTSSGTPRRAMTSQTGQSTAFADLVNGPSNENAISSGLPSSLLPPSVGYQRHFVLAGRTPSDLARAQVFNKAEADLRQGKAMENLMQQTLSGNSGSTLDLARSMGAARHLGSITGAFDSRLRGLNMGDFVHSRKNATRGQSSGSLRTKPAHTDDTGLGQLSARFESGSDGVAAIGYDRNGGTSYGKYQVSSRAGSLSDFLNFLDGEAPDIAKRLRTSGPGNTGSRKGAMPDTWRAIASEQPERFEQLQEAFVHQSHYKPALESIIQRTGLTEKTLSPAMREVIWSTAVQHGPAGAARIFSRADALSGKPTDPAYERNLISNVYKIRVGQFGSSTESVQAAVANRFKQEKAIALNMLDGARSSTLA